MRMLPFLAAAAMTALLVAPAGAQRNRKAEAAALTPIPSAKPQSCVQLSAIRDTRVRDDNTIDFYMRRRSAIEPRSANSVQWTSSP
jgi:hypothetical protein